MHIKENPISKNNKFAGFELDTSKIAMHSTHKREIRLPYSGPLPDALQKNDGVYIFVNLIVGLKIGICLVVKEGKKDRRYSIEATAQEIDGILFGTLPNKRFSTDAPQRGRGKYGSGYPLPMLATNLFPLIPTTTESPHLPKQSKRKDVAAYNGCNAFQNLFNFLFQLPKSLLPLQ